MTKSRPLIAAILALLGAGAAAAEDKPACTAQDFARAVDQSGAQIRAFTLEAQPKLQEKMRRFKDVQKLSEDDYQEAAIDAVQDDKLAEFDQTSSNLLLKVDTLGRVADGSAPDCSKLDEINATSRMLLSVMKAKSDYILLRLDAKIAAASSTAAVAPPQVGEAKPASDKAAKTEKQTKPETAPKPEKLEKAVPAKGEQQAALPAPTVKPAEKPATPTTPWPTATTRPNDAYTPPPAAAPAPNTAPPSSNAAAQDGYSIDEIREATRGFFGGLSTNLAGVIEHAFKESGRPTGYVLGTEGGGAFLAGLRFGKGTLYMRERQESLPVYWHGPSLGTDFGASGSRTLFLIYNLHEPDALFRNFGGVDGSAYVVGGVGVTILKGGDVIMAPIRTGLGLRFGANVGYIRFTRNSTWNPF